VGGGGGPVGAVTIGPDVRFVSSHNGTINPAVDTTPGWRHRHLDLDWLAAAQRLVVRFDELFQ